MNKRLSSLWIVAAALLWLAAPVNTLQAQKGAPPNIILIFADDLGYKDCGFTGSTLFETPHLDALAQKGMVFTNAYASAGNCAPSRAGLMSGRYSPRHGVYAVGSTTRGPKKQMRLVPVPNTDELAPSFVTMAEALKARGYTTGLFGKWHLGTTDSTQPGAQGFDVYFDPRKGNPNKKLDKPDDPKGIFSLTEATIDFIGQNRQRPFFALLAHHAIHSSLEARPASIRKFREKGLEAKMALYAACIYDLDESVGKLMAYLARTGLDKNTLVVFTSDNGATQQSPQEPLRGSKGGYYEGGIREPFIACWPGRIKGATLNPTPIINLDLYPTFLAAAGHDKAALDGENLLPLFLGTAATTRRDRLFWHFPGYLDKPVIRGRDPVFRTRPVTVVRKGDWKLHLYHEEWLLDGGKEVLATNNAVELYDLRQDEGERVNLALTNTAKRDELLGELLAWLKEVKAPMPVRMDAAHPLDAGHDGDGQ